MSAINPWPQVVIATSPDLEVSRCLEEEWGDGNRRL